jgi:hypothetical protein
LIITCLLALALRIRRVCPSIFNCQRPQVLQPDCKSGETEGK